MVDSFLGVVAAVSAAVGALLAISGGIYGTVSNDVSPASSFIIGMIGVCVFGILILSVYNTIKIKKMGDV